MEDLGFKCSMSSSWSGIFFTAFQPSVWYATSFPVGLNYNV